MNYRGRLIFPVLARLGRYDAASTSVDPDESDSVAGGFDPDFREPVRRRDGTQAGAPTRSELEPIEVPCQVEDDRWEIQRIVGAGNDPGTAVGLIFHMADLERLGYVDAMTGDVLVPRVNDRLIAIVDPRNRKVMQTTPGAGLFCTHGQPRSYGLSGQMRNLYLAVFQERGKSPELA